MKAWQWATGEPWAMTQHVLQTLLTIAERSANENLEAIEARVGQPLDNTQRTTVRDGVAIIPVIGPCFRYANLLTRVSGATSYGVLAQDITTALDNPDVHHLILMIDSPGGEVNGCAELAQLIYEAKQTKPITAYVSGDAASGAYWMASACSEIVVSQTSGLGSIGVVGVYRRDTDEQNTLEIVSSQSPHKRLNLEDDQDRLRLQTRIDALADVFIQSIAQYRGIDPETVIADYGGGDLFIGEQAVQQGLADRLGSFEGLLNEINQTQQSPAIERGSSFLIPKKIESTSMSEDSSDYAVESTTDSPQADSDTIETLAADFNIETLKANHPALVNTIKAEGYAKGVVDGRNDGAEEERKRIGAILKAEEVEGRESLAKHFAFDTDLPVVAAMAALAAAPQEKTTTNSHGFAQVMAAIDNPDIAPASDSEPQSEDDEMLAMAERIAAANKPLSIK